MVALRAGGVEPRRRATRAPGHLHPGAAGEQQQRFHSGTQIRGSTSLRLVHAGGVHERGG